MPENDTNRSGTKRAAARLNVQEKFAASERRDIAVRKEIAQEQATAAAKTAKLRALRLAKEEEDRVIAASTPSPAPKAGRSRKEKA
jgi:hypothetical protein